jgi:hypothetical protein
VMGELAAALVRLDPTSFPSLSLPRQICPCNHGFTPLRYSQSRTIANPSGTWFCALEAAKLMPNGGAITLIGSMSGNVSGTDPSTPCTSVSPSHARCLVLGRTESR